MPNKEETLNKFEANKERVRIKADCLNSVDELIDAGKENGIILSAERAQRTFEEMKSENSKLSDDDLEFVAGGLIELVNDDDDENP